MDILEKVQKHGLVFDGAMGSILISKGITGKDAPELWNLHHPDIIKDIHRSYYDAGSDVASANTYGASAIKLKKMGVTQSVEDLNRTGVRLARQVCGKGQYVAGELGSLGDMLLPIGPVSFDEAVDCFAQQAGFLEDEIFFADSIKEIKRLGVEIVGGCCGTTPEYIKKIKVKETI